VQEERDKKQHDNFNTALRVKLQQQLIDYFHALTCPSIAFSGVAETPKGG
jgi:hypothetical protein